MYWWLFSHSLLFRWLNRVDENRIERYSQIKELLGEDSVFGINMGSIGPDQKKSILGYNVKTGEEFFAKMSTSERAKALTRNEIKVYKELADTGLVPKIFDYRDEGDYVFLKCECIKGEHLHGQIDFRLVMDILLTLKDNHYSTTNNQDSPSLGEGEGRGLLTCFSHMDFCPWNMIDVQGKLHIIDWEMAAEMPLGFDLFTYLLQTYFLTVNSKNGNEVIKDNESIINDYFGINRTDWQPYLDAFIDYKIEYFSEGQNDLLLNRFKEMKNA